MQPEQADDERNQDYGQQGFPGRPQFPPLGRSDPRLGHHPGRVERDCRDDHWHHVPHVDEHDRGVSRATGRHQRGRDEYPRHGGRGRQDKPDLGGSIGQQRNRRRGSVADPLARPDHVGREGPPCHEASNGCAPDGGERVWAPPRTGQGAVPPANPHWYIEPHTFRAAVGGQSGVRWQTQNDHSAQVETLRR